MKKSIVNKRFKFLVYVFMFLSCLVSVSTFLTPVYADVPSILNVEPFISGSETILNITVRHAGPTSSHYINTIQVEIDGTVNDLNLDPQTTHPFTVQYNMGELNSEPSVRVRAHCNVHGYSSWSTLETIPEFGLFNSILIFIVLSIITIYLISKIRIKM